MANIDEYTMKELTGAKNMDATDESMKRVDGAIEGETDTKESNSFDYSWGEFFDSGREDAWEWDVDDKAPDMDRTALIGCGCDSDGVSP